MVEGFPLFGTKAFVICCVTTENSNTPGLAVELVQMCRCQYFTTGFATESWMTSQSTDGLFHARVGCKHSCECANGPQQRKY